jgi:transcriptional regulator with XRE-family HTH domain
LQNLANNQSTSLETLNRGDPKSIGEDDVEPFLDKEYRDAYLEAHVMGSIAYQIRTLREQSGLSQKQFGEEIGKPQSVISRLEDTEYSGVTINTLLSIAKARDVGLNVSFTDYVNVLRDDLKTSQRQIDTIYETYRKYVDDVSLETVGTSYAVVALVSPEISITIDNSRKLVTMLNTGSEVVSW